MAEQAKLEDSNVANLGGEDHKNAMSASAANAAEWKGAGDAPGIEIWRIEKFQVVAWPKKKYGTFFSGDSYIVLNTYLVEKKKKYNVHFWLGTSTTQDEQGTAAYKTVELDTLLGDLPVQYREVQGHESKLFLKLFKNLHYLDGGVESGFNHVTPEQYEPRLMHITGKKRIRCSEVPLARASLNNGDVFLLDKGLELIMWNGSTSGPFERRKAQEVGNELRAARNNKPSFRVIEADDNDEVFWSVLGGQGEVAAATPDVDVKVPAPSLWRISDTTGSVLMTAEDLKRASLDSNDVFVLDAGVQVYVWIGHGASHAERRNCMHTTIKYLTSKGRPLYTPITRVLQGHETTAFNSHWN